MHLHIKAQEAHQNNDIIKAEKLYIAALQQRPDIHESLNNLGSIYKDAGNYIAAKSLFQQAVALYPENPTYLINLGLTLWHLHEYDESEIHLRKAVTLQPNITNVAYHTLSYLNWIRGTDAITDIDKAIQLAPESPEMKWDRSLIQLSLGNFKDGWAGYEERFKYSDFKYLDLINFPMWTGEDLSDKKLYLNAEQGLGDIIQIVRYVKYLLPIVKDIQFDVPNELKSLLQYTFRNEPKITFNVMFRDELPKDCDYYIPLGSLPLRLQIDIPQPPYLDVPPGGIKIKKHPSKKAVGIVWAGDPKHPNDSERSSNLLDFVEMLSHSNIELFSLQFGSRASDIIDHNLSSVVKDMSPYITNMADTAAIIQQLDYVVTVDTSVAHLSGALNVPFFIMTPYHLTDWRWMINKSDSPWYPSATIVRQEKGEKTYRKTLCNIKNIISNQKEVIERFKYGKIKINSNDIYVGKSLIAYGEYSESEVNLFKKFITPEMNVIEIGSHMGSLTIPLSTMAKSVIAFEPQTYLASLLDESIKLNNITNIQINPCGLGKTNEVLTHGSISYDAPGNFGGVSLGNTGNVPVSIKTLDSFNLACDFIKIDVEGMEEEVLFGARETIEKYKPTLYVEDDRKDKSESLHKYLKLLGYKLYKHIAMLYNPDNFKGCKENIFSNLASENILCVHYSKKITVECNKYLQEI